MVYLVGSPPVVKVRKGDAKLLNSIIGQAPYFLTALSAFVGLLTVIVFIHELGHFLVGRWCGARVDAFSIGFGREIFGWNDKHGTRWRFAWLPLGGYVKFAGDSNAASMPDEQATDDPTTFHGRPLWQRASIVLAGPMANFLLAIVLLSAIFMTVGKERIEPVVSTVIAGSAAEKAGIRPNDKIVRLDDTVINTFSDLPKYITDKAGVEIVATVIRDGREVILKVTPQATTVKDGMGGKIAIGRLGVSRKVVGNPLVRLGPVEAVATASLETWSYITRSLSYIKGMIIGRVSTDQLAGPVGIAQLTGNVAQVSFVALVHLGAILSISIGLINLFPIPMLDGGHLLYYVIEAVRGKALSQKAQEVGFMVGFAVVVSLMLFATRNDLFIRNNWLGN